MAQHETSLCSVCFSIGSGHQLINSDNVQPRRDFVDSLVDSLNLAWLFPTCQLTRGSTSSPRKRNGARTLPTLLAPRRIPSNHDTQAPLLAIPMHYVIVVAGVTLGEW